MNDVVREFLLETHENLAQLDIDLVTLEKDPTERETLARAFRTLHTVKGTAGFLGLSKLQAVSHAAENLLSRLRAGELFFNAMIAGTLLEAVDAIKRMLASVEVTEQDGSEDFSDLIAMLGEIRPADTGEVPVVPANPPTLSVPQGMVPSSSQLSEKMVLGPAAQAYDKAASAKAAGSPLLEKAPALKMPDSGTIYIPASKGQRTDGTAQSVPVAPKSATAPITITSPIRLAAPAPPPPPTPENAAAESSEPRSAVSDSTIRVDVGLIDNLMNLVGELVLARNQIVQRGAHDHALLGAVQRLDALTTELQAGVMKTRMQPIGNIWTKFRRLVRDIAVACKKEVRLDMDGGETEVDKTIIEAIRDPLTHAVRNAIDHGIELPDIRKAAGKPVEGRLRLHASHEGGKVIIQVSDDGCGIDPQRVRARAVKTKLLTDDEAEHMSDPELVSFVFLPGFTTKDKVDNWSGRGVGMDVVRTNVERIGGTVEIESQVGRGTTVKLKIPLTLAIIPALLISSGGARYAIPQVNLLELVRLEGDQARRGIEHIHQAPVYRLRGQLLPLVYLNRQLQTEAAAKPVSDDVNIVVLQADERQFGLVVDAIHDTQEIVVKPLQKRLKAINAFSGATIMGDGRVALILDAMGLAQRANVLSDMRVRMMGEASAAPALPARERRPVLLCATGNGARMAISLASVARLEEFPRSALEKIGKRHVVQYRDEILPLIDIAHVLRPRRTDRQGRSNGTPGCHAASEMIQVVVYAAGQQRVGLAIGRFLDIVDGAFTARTSSSRPHVLFTAVIQGRVTEFIDVDGMIRAAAPDLFCGPGESRRGESVQNWKGDS